MEISFARRIVALIATVASVAVGLLLLIAGVFQPLRGSFAPLTSPIGAPRSVHMLSKGSKRRLAGAAV
jgi:hypothetical protein